MASNVRAEAAAALERRLGHVFIDRNLFERALTHPSVVDPGRPESQRPRDNQRLEFLGDRVLGLLVAERLVADFPIADEGEMSSRLHALVNKTTCARVAEALGVGPAMRLSPGETKQGGRRREGVLGDAMEALLAAVYLDGGIEAARAMFTSAWALEFSAPPKRSLSNPKSVLQEWALGAGRALPVYRVADRNGPDHAPVFTVEVSVEGVAPLTAQGRSRQEAEKAAATAMLEREGLT